MESASMRSQGGTTTPLVLGRGGVFVCARTMEVRSMATTVPGPPQSVLDLAEKNFRPAAVEADLYGWWERNGFFTPDPNNPGKPFVMMLPLPNVTGDLHLGHALGFGGYEDLMARYHRMRSEEHTSELQSQFHLVCRLLLEKKKKKKK